MHHLHSNSISKRTLTEWLALIFALVVVGAFLTYAHLSEVERVNIGERDRLHAVTNFVANDIQGNLVTVNHGLEGVIQDYLSSPITPEASKYLTLRLQTLEGAIPGIRALLVLEDTPLTNEKQLLADIDHLRDQFPQTQDLYREVCILLFFRYGMTPTANKLYQLVRKGSMSAPAEALNKFWEDLREKSRVRIEHPDLPDALKIAAGELTATLWAGSPRT